MRLMLLGMLVALSPIAQAAIAPPSPAQMISRERLANDVDVLQRAFESLHPGLLRYNTPDQMRQNFAALRNALDGDRSVAQAYLALSEFAAKIECGHTYPNFYNQPKAIRTALFERADRVPFEFRWLDGRMVITRNLSTDAALTPGTQVLSIEGIAVRDILAKLMTIARADGHNDAKRAALLEVQGREEYETFDIYLPLYFPQVDGTHTLRIRGPDSAAGRELSVPALTYAQRLAARREVVVADRPAWSLQFSENELAVLRMPTWALYDTKWNWAAFLKESFTTLRQRATPVLVIDLRGNEGGLAVGDELLAYLTPTPLAPFPSRDLVRYRKVADDLAPYLDTWDPSFKDWGEQASPVDERYFQLSRTSSERPAALPPRVPRFAGKVFVLIGPNNSSATFEFARQIKQTGLGTLVGQTTGGNQRGINGGAFFFLRLPNSRIELDLPLIGQFPLEAMPDAGIEPDVAVTTSLEDIVARRDAEMATVLSLASTSDASARRTP